MEVRMDATIDRDIRMASLRTDAKRIAKAMGVVVDKKLPTTEFTIKVYTTIRDRLVKKPGYTRIYMWAWTLLIGAIRMDDQAVLRDVDEIYVHIGRGGTVGDEDLTVSYWHHKAVFYCWAYFKGDDGSGRRSAKEAHALLAFVKEPGVFPNLTPHEASLLLKKFDKAFDGIQALRPYLFRLSLMTPGLFVLSYTTPYTQVIEDRHITDKQLNLIMYQRPNFYETLYSMIPKKGGNNAKYLSVDDLFDIMVSMDGGVEKTRLLRVLPKDQKVIPAKDGFSLLKKAYFPDALPNIRVPLALEVVGVTDSYLESYETSGEVKCFHCQSSTAPLTLKSPIDNRIYCCDTCYAADWKTCF